MEGQQEMKGGHGKQNRGDVKAKVTVVPFARLSELGSKNWKQWRSLISHHLHRVYSASDKAAGPELPHTHRFKYKRAVPVKKNTHSSTPTTAVCVNGVIELYLNSR